MLNLCSLHASPALKMSQAIIFSMFMGICLSVISRSMSLSDTCQGAGLRGYLVQSPDSGDRGPCISSHDIPVQPDALLDPVVRRKCRQIVVAAAHKTPALAPVWRGA
jgi:hypothetical protein